MRGAFALKRDRSVGGRRMLLLDVVLTIGATVVECVRVLLHSGATAIDELTLEQTAQPDLS